MKKIFWSILILTIFANSLLFSFADGSLNKISLKENNKANNYQVVNLKLDNKIVKSADVPPIIYSINNQGRTLVPLRMILEYAQDRLNAEIEWDGLKQEVKVKTKDKSITLKINSPKAIVNGVEKQLPDNVPAKLLSTDGINARTMVPIRFLEGELGFKIAWDEKTLTASIDMPVDVVDEPENPLPVEEPSEISDVRVEMNGSIPRILIKTSKEISYKQFKLANPERIVIDFDNAKFNITDKKRLEANGTLSIKPNTDVIKDIRVSQFQNDPFISRMVIELGKSTEYEIRFDNNSGEIIIDFINYIRNAKKEIMNTKEVVVIEGDSLTDYNILRLSNPERLVVDIKGGVLHSGFKNTTINVDSNILKGIRASQFAQENSTDNEKIVRVVIDLKEKDNYEDVFAEIKDKKLIIHLEGEPFKAVQYEETGWTTSRLTFKGSTVTRYSITRQQGSDVIEVVVPKKDIALEFANLDIDDHIIKSIKVEEDANGDFYNIKVALQQSVEHTMLSGAQSKDFVLDLSNKNAKYREMLIVIDPGHGGSDPGAVSTIQKLKESNIVIEIGLELNRLLAEAGFRTYMTRVDDMRVTLQERVDVANALNADLFVSIHANAALTSTANGLENLYYPSELNTEDEDNRDNKKLAQIFQKEMVSYLNTNNRGIVARDGLFVLKNTTMPAILTETGFLSNPGDESRLATKEYRQQIAVAMFKSIVRYFEETR